MIRKYEAKDRQEARDIVYDCAFMGDPASVFFDGKKLISDSLSLYFTDYEPQSSFVKEIDKKVVGCLIGAKNKVVSERVIKDKIAPSLFYEALTSGALLKIKNVRLLLNLISSMIKGEFKLPNFIDEYPATFHINIKKEFRDQKIGTELISAFLSYLKAENIPGVHIATMSDAAARFFSAQGFQLLHQGSRSYFKHILHKNIPIYIYGKKL